MNIYRPYKPKRRTRATVAKEKGLEPLAQTILAQEVNVPLEQLAADYVSEEKGVANAAEALAGASDILAEQVSDEAAYRFAIRDATGKYGVLVSEAKEEDPDGTYEMYVGYTENIAKAAGHRILALNRGEAEKKLSVKVDISAEAMENFLTKRLVTKNNPYGKGRLRTPDPAVRRA